MTAKSSTKFFKGLLILIVAACMTTNTTIVSAQSATKAKSQILNSMQNLSLGQGAKANLLNQFSGAAEKLIASPAGSVFSLAETGKYVNVSTTADFGGCGAPNHRYYLEAGLYKYTDSDGADIDGIYVYMNYTDFDCAGNEIGFAQGVVQKEEMPAGTLITVSPFKDGSVLIDVDIVEHDINWQPNGIVRRLTVNLTNFTGVGFIALDKNKTVTKREDFNETRNFVTKFRSANAIGQLVYDFYSYDLSGDAENIVTYKLSSRFEDLL